MQVYYKLLEIQESAGVEEIKKAYRRKAKTLHPDNNEFADAEERFIELAEAYNYLLSLKTKGFTSRLRPKTATSDDRHRHRQAAARKKANSSAKRCYEEESAQDEASDALAQVLTHVLVVAGALFIIFFPLLSFVYYDFDGLALSLFAMLVVSPFLWSLFKEAQSLSFANFIKSLKLLKRNKRAIAWFITFFNIWILLRIGIHTMIPTYWLLSSYGILPLTIYFILKMRRSKKAVGFMACCITPFVFNLLLTANYLISFDPVIEQYKFGREYQTVYSSRSHSSRRQQSTLILLENKAYENYPGIRVFSSFSALIGKRRIEYKFKTGFLGIKVMYDYTLK